MGDHNGGHTNHTTYKKQSNSLKGSTSSGNNINSKKHKSIKNEAILGKYLKERNYSNVLSGERMAEADTMTQTSRDMEVLDSVQNGISRTNAFSYSNVSCLNNTPSIVDQQFAKLIEFIESIPGDERTQLRSILPAMLCHLFIEMTKSRDWKLAITFLKKYVPIVGDAQKKSNGNDEPKTINGHDPDEDGFNNLFLALSNISKKQDMDTIPIVVDFKSCKYNVKLSSAGLQLLKRFLAKHGHILILQILQSRFHIQVKDARQPDNRTEVDTRDGLEVEMEVKSESYMNGDIAHTPEPEVTNKYYLDGLRDVVKRFKHFNLPINIHILENTENIASVAIDKRATVIAGGFEESHIMVWDIDNAPVSRPDGIQQPWSARTEPVDSTAEAEEKQDDPDCCPHTALGSEVEFNGEAHILRGHTKTVSDLLYSRYNPCLLSVSRDCTMRLWSTKSMNCGSIYRGHNHPIWCVAESSNGYNIATGSKDSTARLWVTDREFPLQVYAGHKQDVEAIDFHPNGNYFATASDDLTIRLWCVTSGKLLRVFTNCKLSARTIKFSPDGKYLAAAGLENKIRIFDLAGGQQLVELKNADAMESLAWSGNSQQVATSSAANGIIRLFGIGKDDVQNNRSYLTGCKRVMKIASNDQLTYTCIGIK